MYLVELICEQVQLTDNFFGFPAERTLKSQYPRLPSIWKYPELLISQDGITDRYSLEKPR